MKYKFSFLNIEYGSINLINILKSFVVFFKYIFFSNEYVENKLKINFQKKYKGDIFFLKNARSSLGFFLKSQGIGKDDEPEWNRFQMIKDKLIELDLQKDMERIEAQTKTIMNELWKQQLQIQ